MRLDKKREEEIAQRKGMTGRTIIASIWLLISIVLSYFLLSYLIAQDYLSLNIFYQWGVPRAVPSWVFLILLILIVVGIMQFFLFIGFMLASPEGRRRSGTPSLYSRTKDPFDDESGRG
jgi:hypothetical protein